MALPTSADAIEAFNKRAYKEYEEKTLMTCPYCSRTFKSALNLRTHVTVPQICSACDCCCFVLIVAYSRANLLSKAQGTCLLLGTVGRYCQDATSSFHDEAQNLYSPPHFLVMCNILR